MTTALTAGALLFSLAGCGGSDSAAPDSSAVEVAPGVKAAEEAIAQISSAMPTSIGITEPVEGTIPAGKHLVYISLNVPAATENIQFLKEAAKELDWTVDMISGGLSPEEFKAAFAQAVRQQPDAVVTAGIDAEFVHDELVQLNKAEIPVVFLGEAPAEFALANIYGLDPQEQSGRYNANWVVADSKGRANIVYYDFSAVKTVLQVGIGFKEVIDENCPGCTLEFKDVNGADIGTSLPGQVVSHLRSNPDTDYIVVAFSDLAIGVPGALADAGITPDKVKIVGANPGPGSRVNIAAANYEQAAISFPKQENMWRMLDVLARHWAGSSVAPAVDAPYPYFLFTTDNTKVWGGPAEEEWPIVADYRDQYATLWGLS